MTIVGRWGPPLLLALLLSVDIARAQAQEAATISVEPPAQAVDPGRPTFEVRVMVDNVTGPQGLGGYTLVMTYDRAVARATMVTDSGFVESTGNAVVCPASAIDHDEGRLAHLCFALPVLPAPGPQVTEPQVLATVAFEPLAEGTTTLDISETTIIDPEGNSLEATTVVGRVTVASAEAEPTEGDPAGEMAAAEEANGGVNTGLYLGVGLGVGVPVALIVIGAGIGLWMRRGSAGA